MQKIVLNRKRLSGNHRSHAMNAKRRMWKGNRQTSIVYVDGRPVKIVGTVREGRSLRKQLSNKA